MDKVCDTPIIQWRMECIVQLMDRIKLSLNYIMYFNLCSAVEVQLSCFSHRTGHITVDTSFGRSIKFHGNKLRNWTAADPLHLRDLLLMAHGDAIIYCRGGLSVHFWDD